MHELEWLTDQQPDVDEDPVARTHARRALREHTMPRPSRRAVWRPRLALASIAALVALATAIAWPRGETVPPSVVAVPDATAEPLILLSEKIASEPEPTGDATLVQRRHRFPDRKGFTGHDLYLDDGRYYFGATRAELEAATEQDGEYDHLVEAAAAGSYDQMWKATFAGHPVLEEGKAQRDNRAWFGSMDALLAGAGRADVRAGVMRILAALPKVDAEQTEDTLTITSGDFPDGYQETLIVDAQTGIPRTFVGGERGREPSVTVDYEIRRVTAANWADAAA